MKFVLTLLLSLAAWSPRATADTAPKSPTADAAAGADSSRFLFIIETSSATRSLHEANRSALFEMIFTGLSGQMRTGDTFGIWTYNQETFAGDFPMQTWNSENPMEIASRAALYLAGRKYGGDAHVGNLVSKIRGVSRAVGDVTIFILSDGSMKFEQLTYSDAINTEYQQRAKERSRAKKPFVTSLIARGGKIIGAYVAIAGQPLPIPERPPQIVAAPKSLRPTVLVAPKHALPTVMPAIPTPTVSGPETPAPSAADIARLSAVPETAPEVKAAEIVPPSTPPLVSTPPPSPSSPTSPALTTTPVPARKKVFEFITHSNSSAPKLESVAVDVSGAATNPPLAATPPAAVEPTNSPPVVAKAAEPPPPPPPAPAPVAEPAVAHNPPAAVETPVVAKAPIVAVPQPVAEPSPPPGPKPMSLAVAAMLPEALPVRARESAESEPEEAPPPMGTVTVPVGQGLGAGAQLGIGGVLLASALFLIVIMLRRARPAPQPSLITRSMERR